MNEYCLKCMQPLGGSSLCPECGFSGVPSHAPHQLAPSTVLDNRYLVGAVIGQGGFGITYVGRDLTLGLRVAIKEYYPNGYANRNVEATNCVTVSDGKNASVIRDGKNRFLSEARVLAQLYGTAGIVDVRDFFEANDTAYIVMGYLDGEDLRRCLTKRLFTADQIFAMMRPVMDALEKVHAKGIVHRDISPDNIMILKDGTLALMDFGAARLIDYADQRSVSVVLKAGYAPEEQYRAKGEQGPWTDVYALCATIFKCITGVTLDDSLQRLFEDETRWPSEMGYPISEVQEAVLKKGLAPRAANRFHSIGEMKRALDGIDEIEGSLLAETVAGAGSIGVADTRGKAVQDTTVDLSSMSADLTGDAETTPSPTDSHTRRMTDSEAAALTHEDVTSKVVDVADGKTFRLADGNFDAVVEKKLDKMVPAVEMGGAFGVDGAVLPGRSSAGDLEFSGHVGDDVAEKQQEKSPAPESPMSKRQVQKPPVEKPPMNKNTTEKPKTTPPKKPPIIPIAAGVVVFVLVAVLVLPSVFAPVQYTVTFDTAGGSPIAQQEMVGTEMLEEPSAPTLENHVFAGWYYDEEHTRRVDFPVRFDTDVTLHAAWDEVLVSYSVKYLHDGTKDEIAEAKVVEGNPIGSEVTVKAPKIDGYKLASDKKATITLSEADKENVIKFKYKKLVGYTVNYIDKATGAAVADPKSVADCLEGDTVTEEAPSVSGYTLASDSPQTITLGPNADDNVITFSYEVYVEPAQVYYGGGGGGGGGKSGSGGFKWDI